MAFQGSCDCIPKVHLFLQAVIALVVLVLLLAFVGNIIIAVQSKAYNNWGHLKIIP